MQIADEAKPCGPEASAGYWINRASKAIVRRTDERLREFGLAISYLPVLRALAEGGPSSPTELARVAGVLQPSMTETIARMERDGIVVRQPNPNDRRATVVVLTRMAKTRFEKARGALAEGELEAMQGVSEKDRKALRKILQRVVQNVETARNHGREP